MSGPLSYSGFEKIDTAYQVRDRYQIAYDYYNLNNQNRTWNNASVRGTFDTLQLFDSKGNPKVRIPYTKGDTGNLLCRIPNMVKVVLFNCFLLIKWI